MHYLLFFSLFSWHGFIWVLHLNSDLTMVTKRNGQVQRERSAKSKLNVQQNSDKISGPTTFWFTFKQNTALRLFLVVKWKTLCKFTCKRHINWYILLLWYSAIYTVMRISVYKHTSNYISNCLTYFSYGQQKVVEIDTRKKVTYLCIYTISCQWLTLRIAPIV